MATFAPYLSAYAENLDFVSRARYVGKIELVGGFCDPYIIPLDRMTSLVSAKEIPDVQSPDSFTYLNNTHPLITRGQSWNATRAWKRTNTSQLG